MPWLTMHLVVPLHLLAGWGLGRLLPSPLAPLPYTPWERGAERAAPSSPLSQALGPATPSSPLSHAKPCTHGHGRGAGGEGRFDLLLLLALPLLALFALLNGRAVGQGGALNALAAPWLRWIVALLVVAWLIWMAARRGVRRALRLGALAIVATLLLLTVRVGWNATYRHADLANEFLVYAQGSPDVARVAHDLEALSYRLTGGLDIKLAYDEDAAWPFIWYFRNYTNAQYFRDRPAEPIDADVIIVGEVNERALAPLLEENYVGHRYRLVWWPNEDWYKAWTWPLLWEQLSTAEGRDELWDVLWERKYDFSLQEWPGHLVHTFTVYVREDLALPLGAPLLAPPAQAGGS